MKLEITKRRAATLLSLFAATTATIHADDWMTAANDAQRSSWLRSDPKISAETFQKSGFALEWKLKADNASRQLNSLMPAVLLDFYIGYRGFRALGFVTGSSDKLIAYDTELGRLEWEKNLTDAKPAAGKGANCPGGVTAGPARPMITHYPTGVGFNGGGRANPAKSGVGLPDEGAVTVIKRVPKPLPATAPKPAPPFPAGANPYAPHTQYVLSVSSDGYLHSMWVSNGNEEKPKLKFIPPGADARGLIAYDDTAYVATVNHCSGVEDGVWALDLQTAEVKNWKPADGDIVGSVGPSVGPDGKLYVSTSAGEIVALEPKTLKQLASQKVTAAEFVSSPLVFSYKGKDLLAIAARGGAIYIFDSANLGSAEPIAKTVAASPSGSDAGALTSWEDRQHTRWILAASGSNVVAWKFSGSSLEQGWKSPDMVSPLPPIVTNNVVFALSSGEYEPHNAGVKVGKRIKNSVNAVLYALDGATGKELWNSGSQITSFVHSGVLAGGETRVYLSDYQGNQYAFGVPIEH